MEAYRSHLQRVLNEYVEETDSEWGRELAENLDDYVRRFWLVKPKAANLKSRCFPAPVPTRSDMRLKSLMRF
jgi:glutamate synthase (NADPH/NADH) large chain